jgi:hypothetical protein
MCNHCSRKVGGFRVAAASNSKTLLGIKEEDKKHTATAASSKSLFSVDDGLQLTPTFYHRATTTAIATATTW